MKCPNIFKVVKHTKQSWEPVVSRFLAEALKASLNDQESSLFKDFVQLFSHHHISRNAEVFSEWRFPCGGGRIDILINDQQSRLKIGIEIKTTRDSVTEGQLKYYANCLASGDRENPSYLLFLTPLGEFDPKCHTEFQTLENLNIEGLSRHHISWQRVLEILPKKDEIFCQFRKFMYNEIDEEKARAEACEQSKSSDPMSSFFDVSNVNDLRDFLLELGLRDQLLELEWSNEDPENIENFVGKLGKLADSSRCSQQNHFSQVQRDPFLTSEYSTFHEAVFALADDPSSPFWIHGEADYSLRCISQKTKRQVSLFNTKLGTRGGPNTGTIQFHHRID